MNIYEKKFFAALDKVISEAGAPDATAPAGDVSGAPEVTDVPDPNTDDRAIRDQGLPPESVERLEDEENTRQAMADTNSDTDNAVTYLKQFSEELKSYAAEYTEKARAIGDKVNEVLDEKCTGRFANINDKFKLSSLLAALTKGTSTITTAMGMAAIELGSVAAENVYTAKVNDKNQ